MLENVVTFATYGYYDGAIGSFLDSLGQAGFFSYLLPFLLIFALVYGILVRLKLFESSKAVNAIIALAVGLLALQFDFVSVFFAEVFPRVGVGLAIMLIILIIMGLFLPKATWIPYALFGVSALVVATILIQSTDVFGSNLGFWIQYNWPLVLGLIFLLILVATIIGASKEKNDTKFGDVAGKFLKELVDG